MLNLSSILFVKIRKSSEIISLFYYMISSFSLMIYTVYIAMEIMRDSMFSFENLWCKLGQHVLNYTRVYLAVTAHLLTVNTVPMYQSSCFWLWHLRKMFTVSCYVDSLLRGNSSMAQEVFWNQIVAIMLWRHHSSLKDNRDPCAKKKLQLGKRGLLGKWEEADNSLHTCSLTRWCP